jgi:hypothetical protein
MHDTNFISLFQLHIKLKLLYTAQVYNMFASIISQAIFSIQRNELCSTRKRAANGSQKHGYYAGTFSFLPLTFFGELN